MLALGGVAALGLAAAGGYVALHRSTVLAASPAPAHAVQLSAAAPAGQPAAAPAGATTPETATEATAPETATEATAPETGTTSEPGSGAGGGHADNPADPNVDHQFDGNE